MVTKTMPPLLLLACLALWAGCVAPVSGQPGTGGVGGFDPQGLPHGEGGSCGFAGSSTTPMDDGTVVEPARPPPPISGGTLAVLADGTIVAADPDRDVVYLVSAINEVRTVALVPSDEPGRVIAGPRGTVFVALRRSATVAELDVTRGVVVARHPVCPAPRGLAWSQASEVLYVACATGDLSQLKFAHGILTANTMSQPADDLRDVMVTPAGVLLTTFRDAKVLLVRAADGAVTPQPSPEVKHLFVGGGFSGTGGGVPDTTPNFAPHVAWRTVPGATGAVMVHQRSQLTSLFPSCSGVGYGQTPGGVGTVHTVVTKLSATGVEELGIVPKAVLPVDLAMSPDETMIALASAGTGVWFRKGGEFSQLYAPTPASPAQITAVAFRGEDVVAFSREPALLHFLRAPGSPRLTVMLDGRSIRSTGHDLFHASTTSAIACASCHPEAGEDGHVWRLPEGPRRTPSLRGGLIGTEPFHWSGDQQTMGTLLADVLVKRMGGDSPSAARGAAALKWLDAQPKLPAPRLDGSAVARGKALFAAPAIGCASCHAGELGTNNTNANVGTELSLQVPRLVELAYRAPFFHDGRVPTLAARFTAVGGGDAHGHVSQLKSDEVADLVAYLKSR